MHRIAAKIGDVHGGRVQCMHIGLLRGDAWHGARQQVLDLLQLFFIHAHVIDTDVAVPWVDCVSMIWTRFPLWR